MYCLFPSTQPVSQTGSRASAPIPHSASRAKVLMLSRLDRSTCLIHSVFLLLVRVI